MDSVPVNSPVLQTLFRVALHCVIGAALASCTAFFAMQDRSIKREQAIPLPAMSAGEMRAAEFRTMAFALYYELETPFCDSEALLPSAADRTLVRRPVLDALADLEARATGFPAEENLRIAKASADLMVSRSRPCTIYHQDKEWMTRLASSDTDASIRWIERLEAKLPDIDVSYPPAVDPDEAAEFRSSIQALFGMAWPECDFYGRASDVAWWNSARGELQKLKDDLGDTQEGVQFSIAQSSFVYSMSTTAQECEPGLRGEYTRFFQQQRAEFPVQLERVRRQAELTGPA